VRRQPSNNKQPPVVQRKPSRITNDAGAKKAAANTSPAARAKNEATAAAVSSSDSPTLTAALVGALAMAMVERAVKYMFVKADIAFPAQLAGCIILFFALLVADLVVPGLGHNTYVSLLPGTALLTKWLPVFFVPGLAMLPLAPNVGSGLEVRASLLEGVLFLRIAVCTPWMELLRRMESGTERPHLRQTS
jgi:hypothetical protein